MTTKLPYSSRRNLLTPGERRFYREGLMPAVGNRFHISFKVRLADVITVVKWDSTHGRRISQKHLDFVLTTATARIIAVVELNDSTHQKAERQQRDEFVADALRAARIPFITFPIYGKYNERRIRNRILAGIAIAVHARVSTAPPHA